MFLWLNTSPIKAAASVNSAAGRVMLQRSHLACRRKTAHKYNSFYSDHDMWAQLHTWNTANLQGKKERNNVSASGKQWMNRVMSHGSSTHCFSQDSQWCLTHSALIATGYRHRLISRFLAAGEKHQLAVVSWHLMLLWFNSVIRTSDETSVYKHPLATMACYSNAQM